MSNIDYKNMATDIYNFCKDREIWYDAIVYFNRKAWTSYKRWGGEEGKKVGDMLYEYENKDPRDYFEYGNPDTLSMSFEGKLYEVLNYYWENSLYAKWQEQFCELFDKYDCYFELGNSWNLTVVED